MIQRDKSIKDVNKLTSVILFFSFAIFITVIIGNYIQYKNYERLRASWLTYQETPEEKAFLLNTLLRNIGYSSFIHDFKNLILRGDRAKEAEARKSMNNALNAISKYRQLEISNAEVEALNNIESTLKKYAANLDVVATYLNSYPHDPIELDKLVKVDDTAATEGLDYLYNIWLEADRQGKKVHANYLNKGENYIISIVISIPCLLIAGSVVFIFLRKLWRELEFQSAKINSIVQNTAEGIVTINARGNIVLFNPAAANIFGYSVSEVVGQNISLLLPDGERLAHRKYVHESDTYEDQIINQTRVMQAQRKDGNLFDIELNVSRLTSPHGKEFVGIFRDVTERIDAQKKIEHLALTDQLTQLANRARFLHCFQQNLAVSIREKQHLALLMLDLDKFKPINDTFGHPVGDAALKEIARIFKTHCRDTDTVSRLGGDEFAILLVNPKDINSVREVTQRIIDHVKKPKILNGHSIELGVSIGVSMLPQDGSTRDELISRADKALYRAKEDGRNRCVFYHEM